MTHAINRDPCVQLVLPHPFLIMFPHNARLHLHTPLDAGIVQHAFIGCRIQTFMLQSSQHSALSLQQIVEISSPQGDAIHPHHKHLVSPTRLVPWLGSTSQHSEPLVERAWASTVLSARKSSRFFVPLSPTGTAGSSPAIHPTSPLRSPLAILPSISASRSSITPGTFCICLFTTR